ncbi:hypothetical protein JL721_10756 [Aureococcus anophagefferens]|nr:hypothetical protein JL721_10756 [Aureococcus anophagefferens]
MRVETLCEGQWLASSTFCELPVGKRVAICMLLFTAVMLGPGPRRARVATAPRSRDRASVAGAAEAIGAFAGRVPRRRRGVGRAAGAPRTPRAARTTLPSRARAVKAKAEAERQRARGKPPPPKARKASAARPRAPAKAEPAAKPADSEKLDVVPEVVPAEPAGVSYVSPCVSPDDGVGVEESKGGEFGVGVEESKGAEPFEETPSESTEGSSLGAEAPSSAAARAAPRCSSRALVVLTTAAEVGWLVYEHVRRSAAVRRALETAIVLRVCRAVHETQRERGLLSTYVASGGRANALELGQQFLRTDAALDLAVGAALRHADTVRVAGARSGDTDLSPRGRRACSTAPPTRRGRALRRRGRAVVRARAVRVPARDGCRKACARLAALLRHREATSGARATPRAGRPPVAFDAYSALNENLLTVARDAAVELMRAGLRAQHLAPSLVASVALAAKEHAESSLQSFLALAPKRFVSAYARHAALDCVHEAAALRGRVLADDEDDADHAEYFALQSCRIDSLQAMMDDLQAAILADALASQRAALWRLLYLGAPLESVAERLDRPPAERK